jgi:large subunit ribosomal protein L24
MAGKVNIKAGDTVYVLSGKARQARLEHLGPPELARLSAQEARREAERHPGRRGKVLAVRPRQQRVIVEGVNMVTKHLKGGRLPGRAAQMQTGRVQQPAPLYISKVMLVCPRCDRPTKVTRREVERKQVRVCRRCGEVIDEV